MKGQKVAFLETPPIPRFGFGFITQKKNIEAAESFRFSINSNNFCPTLILET